jgi:hypothetical protein
MITEPTLPIERKGIDLIQVPNYLHVMMLAEPGWVIPAGRYERRYAALDVSAIKRRDKGSSACSTASRFDIPLMAGIPAKA